MMNNYLFKTCRGEQWRNEGVFEGFKPPPPKFRSFNKVEPDCKLSEKCLVFLFQHTNYFKNC